MKKFFIAMFLLIFIFIAGASVFLLTLDVNKYKPFLIEKAEESLNKDVELDNISLSLFPPIAVSLRGLKVKEAGELLLDAGFIDANAKILPLFKKDIQIEQLVTRDADVFPVPGFKINVGRAVFRNVSLYGPVNMDATLSVYGRGRDNAEISAILYPEIDRKEPYIRKLSAEADLGKVDFADMLGAAGMEEAKDFFSGRDFKGKASLSSEKVRFTGKGMPDAIFYFKLTDGYADVFPAGGSLREINAKATIDGDRVVVDGFTGVFAGGNISVEGDVTNITGDPVAELTVSAKDIQIQKLLPQAGPAEPSFEGTAGTACDISFTGTSAADVTRSLSASGNLFLKKGVLKNINVLTTALDKLDMLPRLVEKLKKRLPEKYQDLLQEKDTRFDPIDLKFKAEDGRVYFDETMVASEGFYIMVRGYVTLRGSLSADSRLFIYKDLSEALVDSVEELGYLQNSKGEINMPIAFYGDLPDAQVVPDLNYVIEKLAVSKGQELLDQFFKKKDTRNEEKDAVSGESTDEESQRTDEKKEEEKDAPEPSEVLIRTIFDIIGGGE